MRTSGSAAHGDYVFGWEGDSLQKAMDKSCNLNKDCPAAGLTAQTADKYNACTIKQQAPEPVDGCKSFPPHLPDKDESKPVDRGPGLTRMTRQGSRQCPWARWLSRPKQAFCLPLVSSLHPAFPCKLPIKPGSRTGPFITCGAKNGDCFLPQAARGGKGCPSRGKFFVFVLVLEYHGLSAAFVHHHKPVCAHVHTIPSQSIFCPVRLTYEYRLVPPCVRMSTARVAKHCRVLYIAKSEVV